MATPPKYVVRRILAAKDEGLVSDKAYHVLRMALPEVIRIRILPLSAILQERKRQDMSINILPMPLVKTAYSMFFCSCKPNPFNLDSFFLRVFFTRKKMLRNIVCFYLDKRLQLTRVKRNSNYKY